MTYRVTDEFGYHAVEDGVLVPDLHAAMLHLDDGTSSQWFCCTAWAVLSFVCEVEMDQRITASSPRSE